MRESGDPPAQEIEKHVSYGAEPVLDIVAEDMEGPHIEQDVPDVSMNKHEGQERKELLARGEIVGQEGIRVPRRDQAVEEDKVIDLGPLSELDEIHPYINRNNQMVDDRVVSGFNRIADGNHGMTGIATAVGSIAPEKANGSKVLKPGLSNASVRLEWS